MNDAPNFVAGFSW